MGLPIDGPCGLLAESYILKCELAIALQLQLVEGHQGQMMYHSLSLFAMRFGVCGGGLLAVLARSLTLSGSCSVPRLRIPVRQCLLQSYIVLSQFLLDLLIPPKFMMILVEN